MAMSSPIVAKFGGTSMATGASFGVAARRMRKNDSMRIVVVSAPGTINERNDPEGSFDRDTPKVTNMLYAISEKARKNEPIEEDVQALEKRYSGIEDSLAIREGRVSTSVKGLLQRRLRMSKDDDAPVAAIGEELNARLFAAYLNMLDMRSRYLDPADAGFRISMQNGIACVEDGEFAEIGRRIRRILEGGERVVFPGFFGYDAQGKIRTFPRGGSDYTGAILSVAADASVYQNFTDTDGIRAVEPEIDPDAPQIREMTHRELTELTLGGKFGVFQYEAAVPLAVHGKETQILDTFNERSIGTMVSRNVKDDGPEITGIVHRGEFAAFEIIKYGIANAVGFFKQVAEVFEKMGVSVEHAPSSTNDISVIVRKKNLTGRGLGDVAVALEEEIRPHQMKIHELSSVAVVGEGVGRTRGLGRRIFESVERAGVNVPYHSHQGISFILWLRNGDAQIAAKAIYESNFKKTTSA
jgi:aspartate kinase